MFSWLLAVVRSSQSWTVDKWQRSDGHVAGDRHRKTSAKSGSGGIYRRTKTPPHLEKLFCSVPSGPPVTGTFPNSGSVDAHTWL